MTTVKSGLDTDYRGSFAVMNGRLYFANDHAKVLVWNPPNATAVDAGIDAPSGAIGSPSQTAAGSVVVGDHLLRYRYRNTKTGYVSDPSDPLTVTVSSSAKTLKFDIAASGTDIDRSTDTKVNQIMVEMSPVGDDTYYTAATVANSNVTSVSVSISDTSLVQQESIQTLYGSYGHEPPPLRKILVEHNGRMFACGATLRTITACDFTLSSTAVSGSGFSTNWAGRYLRAGSDSQIYEISAVATASSLTLVDNYTGSTGTKSTQFFSAHPNRVYWSASGLPESFKEAERARDFLIDKSDILSAAFSHNGDLWLLGQNSMERLSFVTDPGAGTRISVPTELGAWNNDCIVSAEGIKYGFGRGGVWRLASSFPEHISPPIDETLDDLIDRDYLDDFHGCYDPVERVVRFWFVKDGDTVPKYAITYEITTQQWWIDEWRHGITSSALVADSDGNLRCMVGDSDGFSWFLGARDTDGGTADNPVVVTGAASSTTTVINVDETITDATATLAGAYLYDPVQDEARRISAQTSSSITVATAFSNAPPDGRELYIGSIPFSVKTKHWIGQGLQNKKRVMLYIKVVPSSDEDTVGWVKFYQDFSTSAWTADVDYSTMTDVFDDGVAGPAQNGSKFTFTLTGGSAGNGDGFVRIPVPDDWVRAIQAEVGSEHPEGEIRITDIEFRVMDEEEVPNG